MRDSKTATTPTISKRYLILLVDKRLELIWLPKIMRLVVLRSVVYLFFPEYHRGKIRTANLIERMELARFFIIIYFNKTVTRLHFITELGHK